MSNSDKNHEDINIQKIKNHLNGKTKNHHNHHHHQISTPKASTPIRLNSPHMSITDLSISETRPNSSSPSFHQQIYQHSHSHDNHSHNHNNLNSKFTQFASQQPQFENYNIEPVTTIARDNTNTTEESTTTTTTTNLLSENPSISPPPLPSTPNSVDIEIDGDVMPSNSIINNNKNNNNNLPKFIHKWTHTHSILCCIASPINHLLYCGTQDGKVLVYDIDTYSLKFEIERGNNTPHQINSILSICLNKNEDILFVAGSDSLIKIYDIKNNFNCTHILYSLVDIGDIYSINWCDNLQTIYIGAQNASILWCKINDSSNLIIKPFTNLENLPSFRYDKFFDSKGPGGSQNTIQTRHELYRKNSSGTKIEKIKVIEFNQDDIIRFAHNGYIYCLEIIDSIVGNFGECKYLISGGGDGVINIWSMNDLNSSIKKLASLENDESVLSMTIQDSLLYVGLGDSCINVWDLMTLQLIRSFIFDNEDEMNEVLSLGVYNDSLYKACSSSGLVKLTMKHKNVANSIGLTSLKEDGIINTVTTFKILQNTYLLAGGNKSLAMWDITDDNESEDLCAPNSSNSDTTTKNTPCTRLTDNDLLTMLKKFISYKTISKNPQLYLEDCRHCAQFLIKLFNNFNAYQTKILPVKNGNPIVFAEFKQNNGKITTTKERVLFYGHYDVVDATNHEAKDWSTNPFQLTAKEGNLYARGVSDNKGPILAVIYAVAELFSKNELSCDVIFIIEGEEECGSIGFQQVINDYKSFIGEIDWIILSNSYWLDDITPCLNYGLRGVINAHVKIKSDKPDRHSGVDGGVSREPVMDLMHILSNLMDPKTQEIKIKGFYNKVLPLSEEESEIYSKIQSQLNIKDIEILKLKWRQPSLTIHKIQVSGPNNNTVIPQVVNATISIRIVPNQDLNEIKNLLIQHLNLKFSELNSDNKLSINIFHEAEPWLGNPNNKVYKILYNKMKLNWLKDPIFIREGGSIPSIRFLEKTFNAPAIQIPCGQSSDNAHLKDEKLRIINLFKLRKILYDTLKELAI
ncbi:uncharacterized protein KGF55_004664 [Candida pseudojiufengensis]|uniref:uncharacterized protein n=1 Tax=Candida pseudojiufengensis TaxID=497109 RepID=UPI002224F4E8|nr:uncharacterized protein KGF55_004664 [Candida pseudojiufengensis]KAI5960372.1 hypothetical protein KGF55_004664 [Candida pseudojiufengensis]